ncbi:MAG: rRNA pseudouridine synthase [Spirochaetota bacterium]|nr:rRNA pseudouridine synthase [Spirochaetota bacterium]
MRLNRFLALCGIASRRKCEEYILNGDVSVNGLIITNLATIIDPKKDRILFHKKQINLPNEFSYYVLNKPAGCLSSASDPHNRMTVYSLLKGIEERVFHVGRLDQDSEGLLLFTNDGKLAHRLLHPKYQVKKKYFVKVNGYLTDQAVNNLKLGIELEEGKTNPSEINIISRSAKESSFDIIITQGWKRQIRRMIDYIGLQVAYLRRDSIGPIILSDLELTKWRKLSMDEIKNLKRQLKLL